ncbi:hypothetical protein NDU88_008727 [Pleurodeles waltl]|uniref:Uncharacterized protein n=1 Tax=Pleurodeles waltl TaxID=8319 RepID=A0AAV7RWK0_PLEWA|nr:hypothetical protein NDU88_008727 [Pleurodeles waltl]
MVNPEGQSMGDMSGNTREDQTQGSEPSLRSIIAAIQDILGSIAPIESKLDTVSIVELGRNYTMDGVTLLMTDGRNVMDGRTRVVDEGRIHIFSTPEDAWMWAHAKGFVEPHSGDPPEGIWLTPQPRRKKRTGGKMRPSRAQAAVGQAQAVLEATQLSSNPYAALHDGKVSDSDSSMGRASGSMVPSSLGPEVTP